MRGILPEVRIDEWPFLKNPNPTSLDDVHFYNRALSVTEVKTLCGLEKPKGK